MGFLLQLLGSAVAVALLTAFAGWAKIARDAPPLDEAHARRVLAEEFPDHPLEEVRAAADGSRAVARSGGEALIVMRLGDGYVAGAEPYRPELWPA